MLPNGALPGAAQEHAKLARLRSDARAAAVYDLPGQRVPPDGDRETTPQELHAMNLKPEKLEHPVNPKTGQPSEFHAAVFVNEKTGERIVAFEASSEGRDWANNAQQAARLGSYNYTQAQVIGNKIASAALADQTHFAGHSLGGGLASAASRTSGIPASTFNVATLQHATVAQLALKQAVIDAVNTKGEPLTRAQPAIGDVTDRLRPMRSTRRRDFGKNLVQNMPWQKLGAQKDAGVERPKALHSIETMQDALARRSGEVDAVLVQNKCN